VTDGAVVLGKDTTARIITINVLGKKAVELQSRGTGSVASGATFHQSQAPYDITQALEGLTSKVGSIDVGKVTQALNAISSTFVDTPPQVTKALTGLQQVADTVASRDGALRQLLGEAKSVTGVLASRNDEIVSLLTDGSQLLSELDSRRDAITGLLANASKVAQQISGLVKDQQGKLAPALKQLRTAVHLLNDNKANVAAAISKLGPYATALGDAVGSGPYFTAYVPNLSDPSTLPIFPELLQGLGSSLGGAK
jgi:phospholipid/cholesterol/gamma-HCH transport system substrate-binding protein